MCSPWQHAALYLGPCLRLRRTRLPCYIYPPVELRRCCMLSVFLQNLNSENMEEYIGYELPAKFLEVDEVSTCCRGSQAG